MKPKDYFDPNHGTLGDLIKKNKKRFTPDELQILEYLYAITDGHIHRASDAAEKFTLTIDRVNELQKSGLKKLNLIP